MTTPSTPHGALDLRARLEMLGDARDGADWRMDERNYVTELGVTAADIPELVSIAVEWAEFVAWDHATGDDEDSDDDDDEPGDESADLDDDGSDEIWDDPQTRPDEEDTTERTDAPTAEASVAAGSGLDGRKERDDSAGDDAEDDPDVDSERDFEADSDDDEEADADEDDGPLNPAVFAPIHAWRTLAQLRAVEAVRPLLETINILDECGDDWYLEEYPHVFTKIGPACIPALETYLRDQSNAEFGRISTATSLTKLAQRFPEHRTRVVAVLLAALQEDETPNFVGFMISDLIDLRATEGALLIERAFAANRVDLFVTGSWNDVKKELGVPGTGLVPAKLARGGLRAVFSGPGSGVSAAGRREWNEAKSQAGFGEPTEAPKRFKTRKKKSR